MRPITGILLSSGMATGSKPASGLPTQLAPTKDDRPTPKMVSARPVAT